MGTGSLGYSSDLNIDQGPRFRLDFGGGGPSGEFGHADIRGAVNES